MDAPANTAPFARRWLPALDAATAMLLPWRLAYLGAENCLKACATGVVYAIWACLWLVRILLRQPAALTPNRCVVV